MSRLLKVLLILSCLLPGLTWSVAAAPLPQDANAPETLIRLQFATFDPLQAEPSVPQHLKLTGYVAGQAGPYIVQFQGPVQTAWTEAVIASGGQIDSYLPDFAYIVRLDENSRAQVEQLDFVRWVGIYQPAYKLPPQLTASPINLYRVHLASWSDATQVRGSLAALSGGVEGEGTALVISASFDQLAQIAQLPDVLWIEEFRFFKKYNSAAAVILNAATAWGSGYTGAGQIVTIADTGLDTGVDNLGVNGDIHLDFDNRVTHIRSWPVVSDPGCIANPGANDGAADVDSGHGTHVAGSVGGNGARSSGQQKGIAYQATLTFQAVEQFTQFTGICGTGNGYFFTGLPNDLNSLFLESYNWGARIHTNSWGSDAHGQYDVAAQQADQFTWGHKNFTILFAAGNAGIDANFNGFVDEDSTGSPATAKNVITIGASENNRGSGGYNPGGPCSTYGTCWPADFPTNPTSSDPLSDSPQELAAFSSRGPTDDGRIKPDLVAPGTNILSTRSSLAAGNLWGAGPNQYYVYSGGTSMATPLAAGAATVVRDYLVDGVGNANPSAALIKAILINSAVDITGYGNSSQEAGKPIPNNHEGWGRINLAAATNSTNRRLVDNQSLTIGVTHTYNFTVTNSAVPLKTSLVWTDYQGNPAASIQLVNNLNLRVTAPNGTTTYLGNRFSGGWSTTGGSADGLNNVENVYIQSPATGRWKVEIIGFNVPLGPQPYALVVYGQGTFSGPTSSGGGGASKIYLPFIIKSPSSAGGPNPGFWESTTGDEFYVTTDRKNVDNFAIYVNVTGCGLYKITHLPLAPIANSNFSFSGTFYASGTFKSATTASGTDGLSNFLISGCGYVNGGPWSWNAAWQNSSQPTVQTAEVVGPEVVEPTTATNSAKAITTVTPVK
jgi:subtilisin family serine protease